VDNNSHIVLQSNDVSHSQEKAVYSLADLLVDYLVQLGVKYVFGVPGGSIEPFYDALARGERAGKIKSIVTRHETGAAFMCDGYTSQTGIIGVCCSTTGPGATNLVTGIASAYANQIPLLFISAQTPLNTHGGRAFQDSSSSETGIDTVKVFDHITVYNQMITHIGQFEQIVANALRKAFQSPRGPVHLSIPKDIFAAAAPVKTPSFNLSFIGKASTLVDQSAVEKLCDILTSGYKIIFVLGDGCAKAIKEILEVATLLNIQVVTTPHGKGLISPYHPLYRGVVGFAGHITAHMVAHDKNVRYIIAIGARFGEWERQGWDEDIIKKKLVHVVADSGFFICTHMASLHVQGNIRSVFNWVLDYLEDHTITEINASVTELRSMQVGAPKRYFSLDDNDKYNDDSVPIKPQRLMKLLPKMFPKNTYYLADIGNSFAWAIHYLNNSYRKGSQIDDHQNEQGWAGIFRTCLEFSSMGWAQGAAIGTAFARPNEPVVCITGDGSMLMNGQELTVALQESLMVIFVVLNDSLLGMVEKGQKLTGAESIGTELPKVSFTRMAKAMGIDAFTINGPKDLYELDVESILNKKSPILLDVMIDRNEVPPIGERIKTLKQEEG
jgi:acetolactate synthase-1/2/3 large subunit